LSFLVRLHLAKAENFFNHAAARKTLEEAKLKASYNIFGASSLAVWFKANNNDNAVHFIGNKMYPV